MKYFADLLLVVFFAGFALVAFFSARLFAVVPVTTAFRGRASWYGEGYRGKTMANGQPFDPDAMTCAAWNWPLGSLLRVRAAANGRMIIVEVTDRGPARWTGCIIDLSSRAFRRLEANAVGRITVDIDVVRLGPEPVGEDIGEAQEAPP